MSDKNVRVLPGDRGDKDTATLLLAAAEESDDFDVEAVQVSSYGGFVVPEDLAKAAGLDYEDVEDAEGHIYNDSQVAEAEKSEVETPEPLPGSAEPEPTKPEKPAKKAAAKKTTAKRAAAKKTGGK